MQWSLTGGQDEIKTVELIIETTAANIDWSPRSRSNSGNCLCNWLLLWARVSLTRSSPYVLDIDPTWMHNVRQRQMMAQKDQQPPAFASSEARTLPQFLSAHESQGFSYAAAVRRSPSRSPVSPWSDSRCSSPTASLSAKLSPLHLGSKGSSPCSTTSESASERERERPLSAGAVSDYHRHASVGRTLSVGGGQVRGQAWTNNRGGYSHNKMKTPRQPGRPRSSSYSGPPQNRPPVIPGILSVIEQPSEERGEAKAGDGGWIKVERQKRLPRQDNKQVRGRPRRGGRGGRGAAGRT